MNTANLQKAIPILASLDMRRTVDFYRDVLGFKVRHADDFSYAMASRDGVELHFWDCKDGYIAENTSCYVRVSDIAALHREWSSRLPGLQAPHRTAWGMIEMYVFDPDRNLLKLGQDADDAPST